MKQLDLFSCALEDQIVDLKKGEELEFFRGKERLLILKHDKYKGACFYQAEDFSGYSLHIDETSGIKCLFLNQRWLEGGEF